MVRGSSSEAEAHFFCFPEIWILVHDLSTLISCTKQRRSYRGLVTINFSYNRTAIVVLSPITVLMQLHQARTEVVSSFFALCFLDYFRESF